MSGSVQAPSVVKVLMLSIDKPLMGECRAGDPEEMQRGVIIPPTSQYGIFVELSTGKIKLTKQHM